MPRHLLTAVVAAYDAPLCGQPELLIAVQDYLLPIALGPEIALRISGQRLLSFWIDASTSHGADMGDYTNTGTALFRAIQQLGKPFLDRALQATVRPGVWTTVANAAVRDNDRALLAILHSSVPNLEAPHALEIGADTGDVALAQWLHESRFGGSVMTHMTLSRAAKKGHLVLVQWLC